MGLRFRKSVKLLPGVRVNFNLHSTSVTLGGRGFHTTYSSTGRVTRSIGIPGTGISYVTSSGGGNTRGSSRNAALPASGTYRRYPDQTPAATWGQTPVSPRPANPPAVDLAGLRARIRSIYQVADTPVDWHRILISESDPGVEQWDYLKSKAEDVLNGDLDTYFQIISDINPVDDLLQYCSEFECGTDDPRMLTVAFQVNSDAVLRDARSQEPRAYHDLLQDYVCGCAIRVARDMLALLPLRHIIINTTDGEQPILSVDFDRDRLEQIGFTQADASDTVELFEHRMDFDPDSGFHRVSFLNG